MDTLSNVLAIILAIVCVVTAVADFKTIPQVIQSMERLKLPLRIIPVLGVAKLAGAFGLVIGLSIDALLVYSAICLTVYFVLATWFHLRVKDGLVETAPAATLSLVSLATLLTAI
ncbi:MAG: DoxX family protein [Actinomycetota bacterium]